MLNANKAAPGNPLPYISLGTAVLKFRRAACDGLRHMSREQRQAYGAAVEEAVKRAQRAALLGPAKNPFAPIRIPRTEIGRLTRYENPLPMAGDPSWTKSGDEWQNRAEALYAAAMAQKQTA